ncbi:MAG TPA: NAD-dependent epimerase/dehydratase family protein [Bacteroidetes bacterium]|nr:NAD-dependent epimerase/dehydratase family protein [Bacteroidota bacterium]
MQIVITGANGFLGGRLAQKLADQGHEVSAMVRTLRDYDNLRHPKIKQIQGDILQPDRLEAAFEGAKQVYHLAALANDWAPDPRDFYQVNVQGTVNVLEAAAKMGIQKTVVTSTAGTLGPPDPGQVHPIDENHIRLVDFFTEYESSKSIAEERIQHYVRNGLNIVMVNPTRVFGPGKLDRKNGYVLVMDRYLNKAFAVAPGVRDVVGNYVHVDDVVQGHILAMEKGRTGEKYLLGGSNVTFSDLFASLDKLSHKKGRALRIPFGVIFMLAGFQEWRARWFRKAPMVTKGWFRKAAYDWPISSEKAHRELGYTPLEFDEAVKKTVDWLRSRES